MYNQDMIAVKPTKYIKEFEAGLSGIDINTVVATAPNYPAPIIYRLEVDVVTKDPAPLIRRFLIPSQDQ